MYTGLAFTGLKIRLDELPAVTKRAKWDNLTRHGQLPSLRASHPTNYLVIWPVLYI